MGKLKKNHKLHIITNYTVRFHSIVALQYKWNIAHNQHFCLLSFFCICLYNMDSTTLLTNMPLYTSWCVVLFLHAIWTTLLKVVLLSRSYQKLHSLYLFYFPLFLDYIIYFWWGFFPPLHCLEWTRLNWADGALCVVFSARCVPSDFLW